MMPFLDLRELPRRRLVRILETERFGNKRHHSRGWSFWKGRITMLQTYDHLDRKRALEGIPKLVQDPTDLRFR